jgi:hypothetical protein
MGRFSIAWETEGEVLTASLLKTVDGKTRRVLPKTARQEVSQEIAARVRRPTFAELGIKRV